MATPNAHREYPVAVSFADAKGRRLVAVMPHPDDESYSTAGTLAISVKAGADVTLVCATRGEAGWVRGRPGLARADVAELRTAELHDACNAIGLPAPRFLDWADGEVDTLGSRRRLAELGAVIDELAPDVIITLADDGVYGHRDHIALTATCRQLVGTHRLLLADFPTGLFAPLARHFVAQAPHLLSEDIEPDSLGLAPGMADLCIDIESVAGDKRCAIGCHESQLASTSPLVFLLPGLVEAVSKSEWFTVAAGPALVGDSPFSGLQ